MRKYIDKKVFILSSNCIQHSRIQKQKHGLINNIDTKAKFRHLKKFIWKGTLRQVFIRVYNLEIQPDMLYFRPSFVKRCPFFLDGDILHCLLWFLSYYGQKPSRFRGREGRIVLPKLGVKPEKQRPDPMTNFKVTCLLLPLLFYFTSSFFLDTTAAPRVIKGQSPYL